MLLNFFKLNFLDHFHSLAFFNAADRWLRTSVLIILQDPNTVIGMIIFWFDHFSLCTYAQLAIDESLKFRFYKPDISLGNAFGNHSFKLRTRTR